MKQNIENKNHSKEYELDYRTDAELVESIHEKRRKGLPLDEKEAELAAKQMREDKKERDDSYKR